MVDLDKVVGPGLGVECRVRGSPFCFIDLFLNQVFIKHVRAFVLEFLIQLKQVFLREIRKFLMIKDDLERVHFY